MEGRRQVFVIDDSRDEGDFMRRAVATSENVEVTVFGRAEEALAVLTAADGEGGPLPNLVILDVKMPGLDGISFLRGLRARHGPGDVPVVIFTSSREPRDMRNAYGAGANSYVVKPVLYEAFAHKVKAMVEYWLDHNILEAGGGDPRA